MLQIVHSKINTHILETSKQNTGNKQLPNGGTCQVKVWFELNAAQRRCNEGNSSKCSHSTCVSGKSGLKTSKWLDRLQSFQDTCTLLCLLQYMLS